MNKEIRTISESPELRADNKTRRIVGAGIVFNKESRDLGGFNEIILPEAVEGVLENSDILALLDHQKQRGVLARSMRGDGSLKLTTTPTVVEYEFIAPNTPLGDETIEGIERRDIRGSSFSFKVAPGGSSYERREGKLPLRTITKFEAIYDMSPVYNAAYNDTTVALRSLDDYDKTNPVVEEPTPDKLERPELTNSEVLQRIRTKYHKKH